MCVRVQPHGLTGMLKMLPAAKSSAVMRSSLSICPLREDGSGLLPLKDPSPQISMLSYWFLSVKIMWLGIFNLI